MPIIAEFKGIKIYMNYSFGEHNPPHVHGVYNSKRCSVSLGGEVLEKGRFPKKQLSEVVKFVKDHRDELKDMWDKQEISRIN